MKEEDYMKTKKRCRVRLRSMLALLLCICMVIAMIPVTDGVHVSAAAESADSLYVKPETGDGTSDNPYKLKTKENLFWFAGLVNGDANVCTGDVTKNSAACAELIADIVVNKGDIKNCDGNKADGWIEWTPIGNGTDKYTGVFNGNGHTISGLFFDNYSTYAGLFGYTEKGCMISEVGVVNSYMYSGYYAAGITGCATDTVIADCYSDTTLKVHYGSSSVGGICGYIKNQNGIGSISNCYSMGTVAIVSKYGGSKGGICGKNIWYTTISNCYYIETESGLLGVGSDSAGSSVSAITSGELKSGKVCYLLNEKGSKTTWRQNLSGDTIDEVPVLDASHGIVYTSLPCTRTYSNEDGKTLEHSYGSDSICTACGAVKAPDNTDGVYEINNATELYWFAGLVNGDSSVCVNGVEQNLSANARLNADIIVNEGDIKGCNGDNTGNWRTWEPIGNSGGNTYTGTFDGNGHTISGLYLNDSYKNYAGLVGSLGKGGSVTGVGVINSYISAKNHVGAIAGYDSKAYIAECYSDCAIYASTDSQSNEAGGICGYAGSDTTIERCYSNSIVSGGLQRTGKICGYISNGTYSYCYYTSDTESEKGYGTGAEAYGRGILAATAEEFASGKICYILNDSGRKTIWRQNLTGDYKDSYPVFGSEHSVVYASEPCRTQYSNKRGVTIEHDYSTSMLCKNCKAHKDKPVIKNGVYQIATAGNMYWFAALVNGDASVCISAEDMYTYVDGDVQNRYACAELLNDISLGSAATNVYGEWKVIGSKYADSYLGTFDGNGHTISGLNIKKEGEYFSGIFGYVGASGKVSGIGVTDSSISCKDTGYICVYNSGTIEDCYSTGTVNGTDGYIGGICAVNYRVIRNCYFAGEFSAGNAEGTGAVCGYNSSGSISGCYAINDNSDVVSVGCNTGNNDSAVVTEKRAASGEICYLLNDKGKTDVWRQNLNGETADTYPVLDSSHSIVYVTTPCQSGYSNEKGSVVEHDYDERVCKLCGKMNDVPSVVDNVYQLESADDLYWFAGIVNGNDDVCTAGIEQNSAANAKLVRDIVINDGNIAGCGGTKSDEWRLWIPIGNGEEAAYKGTFDGNGHTISGLYTSGVDNAGLFGRVSGGTVKSAGIINSYVSGTASSGGICSVLDNDGKIINCYSQSTIKADKDAEGTVTGGICGQSDSATITNCYNSGMVTGNDLQKTGAVVGCSSESSIERCYYPDYYSNINGSGDGKGDIYAVTDKDFASGRICYLLNESGRYYTWRQNITGDTPDGFPVLDTTHSKVYVAKKCPVYVNEEGSMVEHSYTEEGICSVCGKEKVVPEQVDGIYQIADKDNLEWFAGLVNGDADVCKSGVVQNRSAKAVLVNDIVIIDDSTVAECNGVKKEGWDNMKPVGCSEEAAFNGTFDGNGHTISGLYMSNDTDYTGLFGVIDGGKVMSVGLVNSYIKGAGYTGGVCGKLRGDGSISTCYSLSTVEAEYETMQALGGICGYVEDGIITGCYDAGNLVCEQSHEKAGLITGCNNGDIVNCYAFTDDTSIPGIGEGEGNAEVLSVAEAGDGRICYRLNNKGAYNIWRQNLDIVNHDALPVLDVTHSIVYPSLGCPREYSNDSKKVAEHTYEDDICTECGSIKNKPRQDFNGVYQIETAGELYWFAGLVNGDSNVCKGSISQDTGACAVLIADIVLNEGDVAECDGNKQAQWREWNPIGDHDTPYTGIFDGAGYSISGLYIDDEELTYAGIFGYISSTCSIGNLVLTNSYIRAYNYAGGICGYMYGVDDKKNVENISKIFNCFVKDSVITSALFSGGICGGACNMFFLFSCLNTANVMGTGDNAHAGGICGNVPIVESDAVIGVCYALEGKGYDGITGWGKDEKTSWVTGGLVSEKELESGKICYMYGNFTSKFIHGTDRWRQNLSGEDKDKMPVLDTTHRRVYKASCNVYSNDEKAVSEHIYDNGVCAVCGCYEEPECIDDVYQIRTAGDLYWFAGYVNNNPDMSIDVSESHADADAVLVNDIVINEGDVSGCNGVMADNWKDWTPIGYLFGYKGTFNGNGHTISGLYCNNGTNIYAGLFGALGKGASVSGVGVINSYIKSAVYAGGIAGIMDSDSEIRNCYNDGTVLLNYSEGVFGFFDKIISAGGICGQIIDAGSIIDSYNTGRVYVSNSELYCGGICGYSENDNITGCITININTTSEADSGEEYAVVMSKEQFASGEACYTLNKGKTEPVWRQNLSGDSKDSSPVLDTSHGIVYQCKPCVGIYSNQPDTVGEHEWEDGLCVRCNSIEKAPKKVDGVYQIETAGELYWFAGLVNGNSEVCTGDVVQDTAADAVLAGDITINSGTPDEHSRNARKWVPIGYGTDGYEGHFDGQGHSVNGVYYNEAYIPEDENYGFGFFSTILKNASVTALNIENAYYAGAYIMGGICVTNKGIISDCSFDGEISGESGSVTDQDINYIIAGICYYNDGQIIKCNNSGRIYAEGSNAGLAGICARNSGLITYSSNTGDIYQSLDEASEGYNDDTTFCGGVCGINEAYVISCYNTGNVTGSVNVGGLCASAIKTSKCDSVIRDCYSFAEVEAVGTQTEYEESSDTDSAELSNIAIGAFCGNNSKAVLIDNIYGKDINTINAIGHTDNNSDDGSAQDGYTNEIKGMTTDEFNSGKAAVMLQVYSDRIKYSDYGIESDDVSVWGQTIGIDESPNFIGSKVYGQLIYSGCCENEPGVVSGVNAAGNDDALTSANPIYMKSGTAIIVDNANAAINVHCSICKELFGTFKLEEPENDVEYNGKAKAAKLSAAVSDSAIGITVPDIVYTDSEGNVLTSEPVNAGIYTAFITMEDSKGTEYTASVNYEIRKAKTTPTIPENSYSTGYKTDTIVSIVLPEGWIWLYADTLKILPYGEPVTVTAVYNGADKGNYENESMQVKVTREQCPHKDTEIRDAEEATEGGAGYTGDTYCKECGKKIADGKVIPALPTPTAKPSTVPTAEPSTAPTAKPSTAPTAEPSTAPTAEPSTAPTAKPSTAPTAEPSTEPSVKPSAAPTQTPSAAPTAKPSTAPTAEPSTEPSVRPSAAPTQTPSAAPTQTPSAAPTTEPGTTPSAAPTATPNATPTEAPSGAPTVAPSATPAVEPTRAPLAEGRAGKIVLNDATFWDRLLNVITFGQYELPKPTVEVISNVDGSSIEYIVVTDGKTEAMTKEELDAVTVWNVYEDKIVLESERNVVYVKITDTEYGYVYYLSTDGITVKPDATPTATPSAAPTAAPSAAPTATPSGAPTAAPSVTPSATPSAAPTATPSATPTATPSAAPTAKPSTAPTAKPSTAPTAKPSTAPTAKPSTAPTAKPSTAPTAKPSTAPTAKPSATPTAGPSDKPSAKPTAVPLQKATAAPKAGTVPLQEDNNNYAVPKKTGTRFKDATGAIYKVTGSDKTKPEVMYYRYKGKAGKVFVPDIVISDGVTYRVTAIGNKAFKGCKKIKHITIGSNVTKLGKSMFIKCTKLKALEVKTTMITEKRIAAGAFKGISKKVTIKVPKNMLKKYVKYFRTRGLGKKVKMYN